MKKVELTFTFTSPADAEKFLSHVNSVSTGLHAAASEPLPVVNEIPPEPEVMSQAPLTPAQTAPVAPSQPMPGVLPTPAPRDPVTTAGQPPEKVSQVAVKDAMRNFKAANGHKAYKELLAYFGVTTVRDIPKSEYAAVVAMAESGMPQTTPSAIPSTPVQAQAVVPSALPVNQEIPPAVPTKEQLRDALSTHKNKWGLEATKALLNRVGYPDPNMIPDAEISRIIHELETETPTMGVEGQKVDLSMFS